MSKNHQRNYLSRGRTYRHYHNFYCQPLKFLKNKFCEHSELNIVFIPNYYHFSIKILGFIHTLIPFINLFVFYVVVFVPTLYPLCLLVFWFLNRMNLPFQIGGIYRPNRRNLPLKLLPVDRLKGVMVKYPFIKSIFSYESK